MNEPQAHLEIVIPLSGDEPFLRAAGALAQVISALLDSEHWPLRKQFQFQIVDPRSGAGLGYVRLVADSPE